MYKYAEIDPMALLLPGRAYLIWVELHHPHEPIIKNVSAVVKSLSAAEKQFALARANAMIEYGKAVVESIKS